ncbi:unnamed protein product [Effrenium voratum]|uniref:Uncharacterized protein n=1 Tax=Effrenium voratum TaxID=2562239 RepID=A0AA36JG34_9DINO|nr:unnamed protein product [Effrenium voratum]CAJ1404416.1 unnamed protein product [Effrenium voratum]
MAMIRHYPLPPALTENPFPGSSLPVSGMTSGLLSNGLDYPILARNPLGWDGHPPPSPLQQWAQVPEGDASAEAASEGLGVGTPVRLCNFFAQGTDKYNGLIGDVAGVRIVASGAGEEQFLFDVRCPSSIARRRTTVSSSQVAQDAALANRKQLAPLYGLEPEEVLRFDDLRMPPFLLLTQLPSEKLEALQR